MNDSSSGEGPKSEMITVRVVCPNCDWSNSTQAVPAIANNVRESLEYAKAVHMACCPNKPGTTT